MPQLDVLDVSIHYEIVGKGQPVLMIAGTASDGASWAPLLPLLQDRFQLILIDNRGSGQTRHAGRIFIEDIVADSAKLIDHMDFGPLPVIGHSLGGAIGLRLAASHPHKVSKLVTLAAGANPKSIALLKDLAELYDSGIRPQLFFRLLYQFLFSASFFANPANVEAAAEASTNYRHRQSPADLKRQVAMFDAVAPLNRESVMAPVLAISGGGDLLASPDDVTAAHAGIKNLAQITIPGIGHSTHWEAPEAVATAILKFLGD
jgi:aminoacrylate hydrolase